MPSEAIISEKELEFCESWYTPRCMIESLFHDFDNLTDYSPEQFGEIRLYQLPLISDEPIIDFEATAKYHNLGKKEKFKLIKNVGDIYCFGARKFGKTKCVEELDLIVSMLHAIVKLNAFGSVDTIHIKAVLDKVKNVFQNHLICKWWERRIVATPNFKFDLKNGYLLDGVNFNIGSKNPGQQWYGKHVEKVYLEEASLETEEVEKKRKDALSEFGAVFRVSGMTNFTKHSPSGKMYYAEKNQKHVINLPQYVNPYWDEEEKQDRIDHYGGEASIGYKVFVEGEVIEDGVSAIDMTRVREFCYLRNRSGNWSPDIKNFEITRDRYPYFKNLVIVERPRNADRIFVCTDIGKHVSEIIVMSEVDNIYNYLYNITLYNLTQQQTEEILKYIIGNVKANVIGIDCGDGEGRGIYSSFENIYPQENLVYYDGSMKVKVGFEKGEDGKVKMEKGIPINRFEIMAEYSVIHLTQNLLYQGRCRFPRDTKLDSQFEGVVSTVSGTRTIYKCISETGDHLFDTFKVFAIAVWLKADFNDTPEIEHNDGWGGVGATSW